MDKIPPRTTWPQLTLPETKRYLNIAEDQLKSLPDSAHEDQIVSAKGRKAELWLRTLVLEENKNESSDKSSKVDPQTLLGADSLNSEKAPAIRIIKREKNENSVGSILARIESNLDKQPASVQEILRESKNAFTESIEIEGVHYLLTGSRGGMILALVEESAGSDVWKTRAFRFSGSDHQWKSLPGLRDDESYMKGDESNPEHHYVQSAKLHKDMYKVINRLPTSRERFSTLKYIPEEPNQDSGDPGKFWDEFEFKEKYETFKNPKWASFQRFCNQFYSAYEYLIVGHRTRINYSPSGNLYKTLSKSPIKEMQNIKNCIDKISENSDDAFILSSYNMNVMEQSQRPSIQKMAQVYKENIGAYIEKNFESSFPEDIVPDFSDANRIDSYEKPDINSPGGENDIHIEEYKISSTEGDEIVYAMAYDEKGRVYIDNIYDPRVGMNNYGIHAEIVRMGHFVYKPEDYPLQTYGIPDKYKHKALDGNYTDISALWEKLEPIKRFKAELIRRGVISKS